MSRRILLIGATGFFGKRLAGHLAKLDGVELILTSRTVEKAEVLVRLLSAAYPRASIKAQAFDRDAASAEKITDLIPWLVIDTSGPFQSAGYDLARASLQAGAHWIDIADARHYILGFADALDGLAKTQGVSAHAGASSTPALSFAAVEDLTQGWQRVDTADIAIFPGGGVKVGPAVVEALLSYAGQPIAVWREGLKQTDIGWSWPVRKRVPGLGSRFISSAETADDQILSERFGVTSRVAFFAGLESRLEQFGLAILSSLRRRGILRNLSPFSPWLSKARRLTGLGASDKGGMSVEVTGLNSEGRQTFARWSLLSEKGEGLHVPILPALALTRALLAHQMIPGAKPACSVLPLADLEAEMSPLALQTSRTVVVARENGLFEQACGTASYAHVAPAVRAFHDPAAYPVWSGRADIDAGAGLLARLIAKLFGFPPGGRDVPVTVTVDRKGGIENWTRNFAGSQFSSVLRSLGGSLVAETFGPFHIILQIAATTSGIEMPVVGWRLGPLKLPFFLAPRSKTREYQDKVGRFCFDVGISVPLLGTLAHYRGWLVPNCVPAYSPGVVIPPQRGRTSGSKSDSNMAVVFVDVTTPEVDQRGQSGRVNQYKTARSR